MATSKKRANAADIRKQRRLDALTNAKRSNTRDERFDQATARRNKPFEEHTHEHEDTPTNEIEIIATTPSDLQDATDLFEEIVNSLPRDDNGFLRCFIRHDLIPNTFETAPPTLKRQILKNARIAIHNHEGFPAINFHTPIWNQLTPLNEPREYFEAFRIYLKSPARSLEAALEATRDSFSPLKPQGSLHLFLLAGARGGLSPLSPGGSRPPQGSAHPPDV